MGMISPTVIFQSIVYGLLNGSIYIQALKVSDRDYVLETRRIVRTGADKDLLLDDQIKRKVSGNLRIESSRGKK